MNIKQFSIATLVGGVALFVLGFLFYAVLLESFFQGNAGSATGVMKDDASMNMPLLFVGNLAIAALVTYIFLQWAGISTFGTGLKGGLIIGFLIALGYNLIAYSTTNIMTMTGTLVDVVVTAVMTGIAGGVIGVVLGKVKK